MKNQAREIIEGGNDYDVNGILKEAKLKLTGKHFNDELLKDADLDILF